MEGRTISEMKVGEKAEFSKTITETDVIQYAGITGDFNPVHINQKYAEQTIFKGRIAHGMLSLGLVSTVLGNKLPGPGAIYVSQEVKFKAPVVIGDTLTAICELIEKDVENNRATFRTYCENQKDKIVLDGKAVLMPRK